MAIPNRGFGAFIGMGVESTWGTAVARSNWLRVIDTSIERDIIRQPRPGLGAYGGTSTNVYNGYVEADNVGGSVTIPAAYDDSTILLMTHAIGAVSTSGAGPYTHDITPASPLLTGLTIEQNSGTGAVNGAQVFEGCKIASWTFSIEAGGFATFQVEIIGETSGGLASPGSPTYSSNGELILHHHAGTVSHNGNTYTPVSLSVSGTNEIARRQRLGSKLTAEPAPSGRQAYDVEMVLEFDQTTAHADWLASTADQDATITFTGTGNNQLVVTLHNMIIESAPITASDSGVIRQTVRGKCYSDGTNEGVSFAFDNDNASATTN